MRDDQEAMELVKRFLKAMEVDCSARNIALIMHFLYFLDEANADWRQRLLFLMAAQSQRQHPRKHREADLEEPDYGEIDLEFDGEMHQRFVVDMQPLRDKTGFISIKG